MIFSFIKLYMYFVLQPFQQLLLDLQAASFLYYQEKMNVLVEPDVHDVFARISGFGFVQTFYSQDTRY